MRLTEIYSIAAVSLALLASAAAIPVLAYQPYPELSLALQRLQQARYDLIHSSHNNRGCQRAIQETNDAIRDVQRAIQN